MKIRDCSTEGFAHTVSLKIYGFSMVRNEADIMPLFFRQAVELFDEFVFVDVLSTDGTADILDDAAKQHGKIIVYKCQTKEKYQAAMVNIFARKAVSEGADWFFFLDADEFMLVEGRSDLETNLNGYAEMLCRCPG